MHPPKKQSEKLSRWALRLVALPMAQTSQVEGRLTAILQRERNRTMLTRSTLTVATLAAIGMTLPLAALRPSASAQGHPGLLPDAPPPRYAVTELASLPGVPPVWSSGGSGPYAINDQGQSVGVAAFPARSRGSHGYFLHAALWDA